MSKRHKCKRCLQYEASCIDARIQIGGSSLIHALFDAFEGTNDNTANMDEDVNPSDTEVKECPAPGEGSG